MPGRGLGIGRWTYARWESEMTIGVHCRPRIIAFLGYSPLPEPRSLAEAVRRDRMSLGLRGWRWRDSSRRRCRPGPGVAPAIRIRRGGLAASKVRLEPSATQTQGELTVKR